MKKCFSSLYKLFSALNTAELPHKLNSVLSANDVNCDVHHLELWASNTSSIIEVLVRMVMTCSICCCKGVPILTNC